jgi:hypothetical protein
MTTLHLSFFLKHPQGGTLMVSFASKNKVNEDRQIKVRAICAFGGGGGCNGVDASSCYVCTCIKPDIEFTNTPPKTTLKQKFRSGAP